MTEANARSVFADNCSIEIIDYESLVVPGLRLLRDELFLLMCNPSGSRNNRGIYRVFPDPDSNDDFWMAGRFSPFQISKVFHKYRHRKGYRKRFLDVNLRMGFLYSGNDDCRGNYGASCR